MRTKPFGWLVSLGIGSLVIVVRNRFALSSQNLILMTFGVLRGNLWVVLLSTLIMVNAWWYLMRCEQDFKDIWVLIQVRNLSAWQLQRTVLKKIAPVLILALVPMILTLFILHQPQVLGYFLVATLVVLGCALMIPFERKHYAIVSGLLLLISRIAVCLLLPAT